MRTAKRKNIHWLSRRPYELVPGRARQFVLERDHFVMMKEVDPITYDQAVELRSVESVILWQSNLGSMSSLIARDPALLDVFRRWRCTVTGRSDVEGCRTMPDPSKMA